jgi:hypothetical protein
MSKARYSMSPYEQRFIEDFRARDALCEQEAWRAIDARSRDGVVWVDAYGLNDAGPTLKELDDYEWNRMLSRHRREWEEGTPVRLEEQRKWSEAERARREGAALLRKQARLGEIRERARDLAYVTRWELAELRREKQEPNIEAWLQIWRAEGYNV